MNFKNKVYNKLFPYKLFLNVQNLNKDNLKFWKGIRVETEGEIAHVDEHEGSVLSRGEFLLTWSVDSLKSIQNHRKLLCRYQKTDSKDYIERQESHHSQHNVIGKEHSQGRCPTPLQDLMQSDGNRRVKQNT